MLILQNDLTMITVINVQFLFQNKLTLLIPEDFQYLRNCKVVFLCLFVFLFSNGGEESLSLDSYIFIRTY